MSRDLLSTIALIAFWYVSNILVVLSNKFLLSNYGFRFPIFLTGCHMLACATLGYAACVLRFVPRQYVQSIRQLLKIIVLGCVFCVAIVLGNISLKYIPVSFNQAIGATTPFFTAFLSLCLAGRAESVFVYAALIPVVAGIVLSSWGEPLFHSLGFAVAVAATFGRAFKSVLQALLLADITERMDSMNLLLYMSPVAALALLPFLCLWEGDVLAVVKHQAAVDRRFLPALFINASLAFCVNLSNFMVTKHTSALTLQVLGNAKGAVAAVISVLIFRNPVTVQSVAGYGTTLAGVGLYSYMKWKLRLNPAERSPDYMKPQRSLPPTPLADPEAVGPVSPLLGSHLTTAHRSPGRFSEDGSPTDPAANK